MEKSTQQKTVKPQALKCLIAACRKQLADIASKPPTWEDEQALHDGVAALHKSCQQLIDRAHRAGVIDKELMEQTGSWNSECRTKIGYRTVDGELSSRKYFENDVLHIVVGSKRAGQGHSKDNNYIEIFTSAVRHIEKTAQGMLDGEPPRRMYGKNGYRFQQATLEAA
ncbi:MAG: hypothetical protein DHS20C02_16760 [Micavibrio sp.]|nr:MAG: hypothetical protein DHS20C02_16760 [Micavibrio sp.]